ncbi:carboxypeptidase regulatory-like domain-containing protein [Candidatus Dojkabacteria bacterium]|uniref:Carboxypeptidase regulatory-like domain-containing protein n=1 Tax=Candidatus Dojkabacteria bacterium TaxID=2099670 RepID=A0A955I9W8_9BACT|nr:carboxypeptidase regulatory-like domain-containing protein [Candidatus Dojkabacteria bacterium]
MPMKKKKSIKSVFKKYNTLILFPLGTVILLTLCVIIFGLGLDSKLFDSSLEGYIFDVNKNPITGANVCIQSKCAVTEENGFYELRNLKLGNTELTVSSDRHLNLVEPIKIESGVNKLSVELTEATLANVLVTFKDIGGLQVNGFQVKLDNIELKENINPLDENTVELNLVDKKTGIYKLIISSDYYVNQEIDLVVEPEVENQYEIYLEPASNFKIYVQNWLDSSPIPNTNITVRKDHELSTDENGTIAIDDFSIYEKEILFNKDGFLKQVHVLKDLNPGINPDLTIKLVPDGKISFAKETPLGKQIFLSNFDGTESRQLTLDGENINPWIDEKNEKVYFTKIQVEKAGVVHWVDFLGDETKIISTKFEEPARKVDLINYRKDLRIFLRDIEGVSNLVKTNLDDSRESILYDLTDRELNETILSQDGNQLIFSFVGKNDSLKETEGIYSNNIRFNRTTNLLKFNTGEEKRISQPKAVNDDGNILALTLDGELFIHNYSGEQIERITNDSIEKSSFYFQPETNNITYIRTIEERKELVLVDPLSKEMKILTQTDTEAFDYRWLNKEIFNYVIDGELWISSINNLESAKSVGTSVTL